MCTFHKVIKSRNENLFQNFDWKAIMATPSINWNTEIGLQADHCNAYRNELGNETPGSIEDLGMGCTVMNFLRLYSMEFAFFL